MDFVKIFLKHLFTTAIFLATILALLEYIIYNDKYIELYAFAISSFFIITFFQFYIVDKYNRKHNDKFLIQSVIGGFFFFLYSMMLFIFYKNNFSFYSNISTITVVIIISLIIHFYMVKHKKFDGFYKMLI